MICNSPWKIQQGHKRKKNQMTITRPRALVCDFSCFGELPPKLFLETENCHFPPLLTERRGQDFDFKFIVAVLSASNLSAKGARSCQTFYFQWPRYTDRVDHHSP
eukprot:GEMP01140524.1.p1 GENE.GEMP01140524.1~~GEMP01140524.1.p1  ORF type:complete len:105 (-),score=12.95 GEMP01140524.1:146-460(-)